jgi:hypothetical protein
MNFKLGIFKKAIDLGQKAMATPLEKSELSKIKSYFNLKQYDTSIPYLVDYKGKRKVEQYRFYQLGYAHYKQKYESAIAQINQ